MIIMINSAVTAIPSKQIAEFCHRWGIHQLAVFGSALRDDFYPESDLDIMVAFAPDADPSLFDHVEMQLELERLFNRKVDLISRRALEQSTNQLLKDEILKTAQVLYPANETTHAPR